MPIVALPNGTELEFPDGMAEVSMRDAIFKNFPEYAPKIGVTAAPSGQRATDAEIDSLLQVQAAQDAAAGRVASTPERESVLEGRTFGGTIKDIGISALKGAIAVPEAAVGLADIVSGGRAGKTLEEVGFRPKEAKAMLEEEYSAPQKEAFRKVRAAEGLGETFTAAIQNPSVIGQSVVESLPLMGAGGVLARGGLALAPKMGAMTAGALGEGAVGAGSAAETIRQQTQGGLLTGQQAGLAGLTGAATYTFARIGAGAAKRLGIADVDTMLAGAATNPAVRKGVVRSALEGALSEGVLEELPQSVSEQVLQNLALGKPLDEGVNQAAVLGLLSGAAMGGGANVVSGLGGKAGAAIQPPQPRPEVQDIGAAQNVDEAITAATKSLDEASAENAVTNIQRILAADVSMPPAVQPSPATDEAPTAIQLAMQRALERQAQEQANVSSPTAIPDLPTTPVGRGGTDTAPGMAADVGLGTVAERAVEPGIAADQPARVAVPPRSGEPAPALTTIQTTGAEDVQVQEPVSDQAAAPAGAPAPAEAGAVPAARGTPTSLEAVGLAEPQRDGTALIRGDVPQILDELKRQGFTAVLKRQDGVLVGRSQAQRALEMFKAPAVEASGVDLGRRSFNDLTDPEERINLYRGEGSGNKTDGAWWSFDKSDAEQYAASSGGKVRTKVMSAKEIAQKTAQGQGGPRHRVFAEKADVGIVTAPVEPPAPSARQVAIDAERARIEEKRVQRSTATEAAQPTAGLSVGTAPTNAEPVTVKNGVVHIGKYPAQNFDTGEDVTVPADATPQQIAAALKESGALGKRAKFFGLPAEIPSAQTRAEPSLPSPEQQRADFAAAEKTRTAPGNRARSRAYDANPFKAFIAKHGINLDLAGEFTPGQRERQAAMVQGYGPIFRRSGMDLDRLAQNAVEEGFLTVPDTTKLSAMIHDALRGKRIISQYAEGIAESEMADRSARAADIAQEAEQAQNAEIEAETKAEREAIQAVATLDDESLLAMAEDNQFLTAGNNVSEADFLRAMGASEQEIQDATQGQERAGQGDQGRPGAQEAAPGAAPRGAESRAGEARAGAEAVVEDRRQEPRGIERRTATDLRKRVAEMSEAELRDALLTDHLTGLRNRRAYDESVKLPIQVSIDADSLKWVNDNLGHESGDQLLKAIGQALGEVTQEAYHVSGDEFIVQANTEDEARIIMNRARIRMSQARIEAIDAQGKDIVLTGVGVSYGIAGDLNEAERFLGKDKAEREKQGLRAARGEVPPSAAIRGRGEEDQARGAAAEERLTAPSAQEDGERFERAMRAAAKPKGGEGDVQTTGLRYVPFETALNIARDAVAAGVRPVPAQFHFRLDLTLDSADRLLAALNIQKQQPAAEEKPASQLSAADLLRAAADKMEDKGPGVAEQQAAYGIDDATGLPLNADGSVTVYHHTSAANAQAIRQTGVLKAQAEPDVYVTTHRDTDTGYGDTAVPIRVQPGRLMIDDEFPNGRKDFRLNVGRPGGSIRVNVANEPTAPENVTRIAEPSAQGYTDPYEDIEQRPGTTEAQRRTGREALAAVERRIFGTADRLRRFGASVLGSAVQSGFRENGYVSLVGQQVESSRDLAIVAQVLRDPRFETFRVFYMKDGKIAGERAYSSRMAGSVFVPADLSELIGADMQRTGASGYWLLHNHPSGRAVASSQDIGLTEHLNRNARGMLGHVIIDHNEYNAITIRDAGTSYALAEQEVVKADLGAIAGPPEARHHLIGEAISSPNDVAAIAKRLQAEGIYSSIIGRGSSGRIVMVLDVPNLEVKGGIERLRAAALIRRAAKETSAVELFAVVPGDLNEYTHLTDAGLFRDMVSAKSTESAASLGLMPSAGIRPTKAQTRGGLRYVAEPVGEYEAEKEPRQPVAPGRLIGKDQAGRQVFAPGQALYDLIGKAASPLLIKLQMKSASPELTRQLRQMKLDVQKAQDVAVAVAHESQKLSEGERLMVSDIIEKELAAGTIPPEHAVRLATVMNEAMHRQSDELVRLGMLSPEAAKEWDGRYLPRFYESKLKKQVGDAWADAARAMGFRPKSMKGIKGQHLKGRGLYETIPENQLANYEAMGWKVRDPDYTPSLPSVDGTVQVWRDFTRAERESMGEIRDSGFRFVMGYMQTQRDIALGRMFEGMANNPEMSSRLPREGWIRVPDSTVEGTGAKRYGKLAGRYVPMETLSQLTNFEEAQSAAWRMYRGAMSIWKQGKTSLNPVSHINNIVSNLTMAHFAGIGYHRADKYVGALRDFVKADPMVKEARDAGLFLGTMSDAELMNTMPAELRELAVQADSKLKKGATAVFDAMTFWLRKPMGTAYQAEDTFFRYLIYRDARQRGVDPQDAVDYAQKYIFTYDDLPKGARMVRDFGIPFFAYTYKAVPALLNTALTRPDRFLAPAAVLWAANAAAYAIAAGDDDDNWMESLTKYLKDSEFRAKVRKDEKLEREFLPPWMKGNTALMTPKAIRLGMDELTKLPVFIDTSRIIPGGDLFDVSPNAMGLPIPQPVTPSHPLFTMAVAMIGNKDLFLGKEIIDSNDTMAEATAKRSAWIWKQLSPAIAVNNYHWERGMNALAQATGGEVKWVPDFLGGDATGIGRGGLPVQPKYAAMQTFGIKARPIDLETSEQIDNNLRNKMIRDIDAEIRKLQRLNAKGAIADRVLESEWEKAQTKKERLREGLTVDGAEKP